MPSYRITGPDGATYRVTAPEGSTPEQVQQYVQQNIGTLKPEPAGKAGQGGVMSGVVQGLRDPVDAGAQILRRVVPDSVGRAVDRAGNFLADLGLPVARSEGVAGVDQIVRDVGQEYEANRAAAGREGFDFARLAGNVVNPVNRLIPGTAALKNARTVGQLARAGATVGAGGAMLQPVTDGVEDFWTQKAKQGVTGAAAGAVLTPALAKGAEAVAGGAQRVLQRSAAPAGPVTIGSTDELHGAVDRLLQGQGMTMQAAPKAVLDSVRRQVAEAMATGQKLDGAAAVRQAQAEAIGLTDDAALTAGQLYRDPMRYSQERNLSGVVVDGRMPLAERFQAQNQRLAGVFDNLGATQATDRVLAGEQIIGALGEANKRADDSVRAAYTAFRESTGRDLQVPLRGLAQDYASTLDTFGDAIPAAVRSKFEQLGLMGGKQRRLLTLEGAENLIKAINANTDPGNKPAFRALGELRGAVQKAITEAADSASTGAGAEAAMLANEARQTAAGVFRTRREIPALQAALDDVAPDRFVQRFLIGAPTREVGGLVKVLQQSPEAMAQARAQVASFLKKAAFGENLSGDKLIAPERLAKTIDAIGPQKLAIMFTPAEVQQLQIAAKLAADINSVPAGARNAVNYSGTGSAFFNLLQRLGDAGPLRSIPGVRALSTQARDIAQERAVSSALQPAQAATAPAAELSPQAMRALQRLFAPGAVAVGSTAGSGF
jgi:hypothetical protein